LCAIADVVGVGLGVIIGYFSHPAPAAPIYPTENPTISKLLMDEMKAKNIMNNLKTLTSRPHIAGQEQEEIVLVDWIKQQWTEAGIDSIVVHPYDVLLSYPKQNDSNYVSIKLANGTEIEQSQRKELVIDAEQNDPNVVDPFNAYSPPGEPEAELVYVNFATIEDFIALNRTYKINTVGKICISRYGRIFRGDKAVHAELYGCIGLILYSDPLDYTVPWSGVYPEDWFPPTGAQRGTLWVDNGDPRTPNYPSIRDAWHQSNSSLTLPKIPVTPIGNIDAIKYLSKMGGPEVPTDWRGGMNITYRFGPGFALEHVNSLIKMSVKTTNQVATIHNVIGYVRGAVEPDRYVLLGNHRDAWVFGAIDPSSGTATLMELVRGFGAMLKRGWRPRRTLVFCSWGAEEYGLIGSTEWVEELQKELQARAVAYLNVDIAVQGNYSLAANGVASLSQAVFDAAKTVSNPNPTEVSSGRLTLYDTWKLRYPASVGDKPSYYGLGSGSDFTAFLQIIGIPSVDLRHTYDQSIGLASYPVYHSVYETFELVNKFVDPGFKIHLAMAQVWGELARKLADVPILPVDCRVYATDLAQKRDALYQQYGSKMESNGIDFSQLNDTILIFTTSADNIHKRIASIDSTKHVISAPSQHNTYGSTAFPAVVDAMFDIDVDPDQTGRWDEVRRQYSILVFHILSAAATLNPTV
uniref:glutamate carboxypeptidase II n=1 Tax=Ciona savignyi TaxID=51511 RepID=H2Z0Q2_CIOSA